MIREIITEDKELGGWTCKCGNTDTDSGFFPCDNKGNEVEPTPEQWTTNLYVCFGCGRIIDQDTLEVKGKREL